MPGLHPDPGKKVSGATVDGKPRFPGAGMVVCTGVGATYSDT